MYLICFGGGYRIFLHNDVICMTDIKIQTQQFNREIKYHHKMCIHMNKILNVHL